MYKKLILFILINMSLIASSIGININSNTLELKGEYDLKSRFELRDNTDYLMHVEYLQSEDRTTATNDNKDKLFSLGLKAVNSYLSDNGLRFGIGIKGIIADNSKENFIALPLQIFAKYYLNEDIHFDLDIAHAPKVLTFGDGQVFNEQSARANYRLLENGHIYVGLRNIKTKYENNIEIKYDNSAFFGIKVEF